METHWPARPGFQCTDGTFGSLYDALAAGPPTCVLR
jgi:hypothetical protein